MRETANIQWVRVRLCDSLPQPVKNKNKEKGEGRPRLSLVYSSLQ